MVRDGSRWKGWLPSGGMIYGDSLKGQCHENFFKLRPRGVRLSPTDVPEPLFEFLYSRFNLLKYFKNGVNRTKMDNILVSDPDASGYFRY